jgi:hypothetical protein
MELVFLEATQPLTKTFTKNANNSITKSSYPTVYEFTSHIEPCKDLKDFERLLKKHAALGHCLLKGTIGRDLVKESRAGSTESNSPTEWICLDIDSLPGCKDIETFLKAVGLADVSYIVQHSASSLISNKNLNSHLFMLLDEAHPAPLLKQWLIGMNHSTPMLNNAMELTKTDTSLRWPLDISVCQNDKLIYIAPPILKGIADPYAGKTSPRIQLITKGKHHALINLNHTNVSANQAKTDKRINELREAKGLAKRKFNLKTEDGVQYLAKSEEVATYETRNDRGFVYFNINGGDSWGYYHPDGNPKYIRNFKSEPVYLTKELIPEYWAKVQADEKASIKEQALAPVELNTQGDTYLAFCDRKTSAYWRGTYNAQTNILDLNPARSSEIVKSFMRLHGMAGEGPIDIPEWDMLFDPTDSIRVDPVNRIINTFEPTVYMQAETKRKVKTIPKLINRVINHVLGNDPAIVKHFINWLAYIIQYRDRTTTAWVLHGTEGTGKGVLMNKIIRPLLGANQTAMRRMEELNEPYNTYMESCFVVFIDEVETKALANEKGVAAKIRNFITEEIITLRAMYRNGSPTRNYANIIFSSNKPDPISVPKNDRRTNVAKYQPIKLGMTQAEIDGIEDELQDFYDYMAMYAVDLIAVKTPIESADRDNLISISESSVDTISSALLEGDMGFFIDQMPTTDDYKTNQLSLNRVTQYESTLKKIMERTMDTGHCTISRDELFTLFDYVVGGMPASPNKFTSLLKHHRIHISKVWVVSKTVNGIKVDWKDIKQFDEYKKSLAPIQAEPQKLKRVK